MNANSLLRCCLVISVASMCPASVRGQTVDDTGSKQRLERDMRDEASRICTSLRLWDLVHKSIMKMIDQQASLEEKEELLRQTLEKIEGVRQQSAILKREFRDRAAEEFIRKLLNGIERTKRERLEEMKRKARHDIL